MFGDFRLNLRMNLRESESMTKDKNEIQTTKLGNRTIGKSGKTQTKNKTGKTQKPNDEKISNRETIRFIIGILLLVTALYMFLSFVSFLFTGAEDQALVENGIHEGISNYAGWLGANIAYYWINSRFGLAAFFIPTFLLVLALKLTRAYHIHIWKWFFHCTVLLIWFSVSLSFFLDNTLKDVYFWNFFNMGGQHGQYICQWLCQQIGWWGTLMSLVFIALAYLIYVSKATIEIIRKLLNPVDYIKSKMPVREKTADGVQPEASGYDNPDTTDPQTPVAPAQPVREEKDQQSTTIEFDLHHTQQPEKPRPDDDLPDNGQPDDDLPENDQPDTPAPATAQTAPLSMAIEVPQEEEPASNTGKGALEPFDPKLDLENYKYPVLQLLNKYEDTGSSIDMEEQNKNKEQIIEVLQNFGVDISSIKATVGPTITLYEITPAKGVRISKIRNLEDDIALSLSALGIRIIAPIPGKGTIGIEVPNTKPQMVSMESILNSKKFRETEYELPIALGKTITNEVFMVDLAKMPHLLVAGATGQGKSVGLNAIITSLLFKKHPAELKFVMVDPKKVEFSIYAPIENHFLAKVADEEGEPIITDVNKVVQTLKSLCAEMDNRYDLLKKAKARNLKEYNTKFKNRQLNPQNGHRFMPYIVVVIDEFGDLIMTAGKEIELPIARIAQLARAVGIHMIIATQRPTTNIITGTITANFPARMAFKVSSMIDSRTILDRPGANQLIGRGDMLFLSGSEPVRVQCAFVDTPEVERIANYIAQQQSYAGPFELPKVELEGSDDGTSGSVDMAHLDPLFEEAAQMIVATQQGSTSMIQRKFSIGYNRAGRLMDQLEKAGFVGPAQGSKPREVLCVDQTDLEMRLNNLR